MNEANLVALLRSKQLKITAAESCTGGMFISTIINVPHASEIVSASYITYSEEAKINLCNVSRQTIDKYTVVSEEVAKEMAQGLASTNTISVGITGYADGNNAGLVCFGFCIGREVYTYTQNFDGARNEVRKQAVQFAIDKATEIIRTAFEQSEEKQNEI